jgi:hypothetical protein
MIRGIISPRLCPSFDELPPFLLVRRLKMIGSLGEASR